jgi:hypothetical protein
VGVLQYAQVILYQLLPPQRTLYNDLMFFLQLYTILLSISLSVCFTVFEMSGLCVVCYVAFCMLLSFFYSFKGKHEGPTLKVRKSLTYRDKAYTP